MANTMYPAMANSPKTELSAAITATDTTIKVVDATKLPKAPNILTILSGDTSETISYATISGNDLTGCVRGLNGTAKAWSTGMKVARTYTAYDHDTFIEQINEVVGKLIAASTTKAGLVQLSDSVTSTATDRAATANAAKKAYDQAGIAENNAKKASLPLTGGTLNGALQVVGNGGVFGIVGTDHSYVEYYPKGLAGGRKAYTGFADGASTDFIINNTFGSLSLTDTNGSIRIANLFDIYIGTGIPEGVIFAPLGSIYRNKSGGTGTTFYVKEGGAAGNTGWRAK